MMLNERKLNVAQDLAEAGDYDRAYAICDKELSSDPNNYRWLTIMVYIMLQTEKPTIAYHLARRVADLEPKKAAGWLNLGMACKDLRRDREAVRFAKKAFRFSDNEKQQAMINVNIGSSLIDMGEFVEAEGYCLEAIRLNPDTIKGKANLGFCQLAQRQWKEGWENYLHCSGHEWRPKFVYNDEPEWDGEGEGNIVLYGEQGLGDQISFASVVPDVHRWAKKNNSRVILDLSNRLTNLLRRSFPDIKVYGTQGNVNAMWDKEDRKIDHSLPIGQACEYFRHSDDDFPGTPYLKPCPDRKAMWDALFKKQSCAHNNPECKNNKPIKKPVIGIAWSGGIPKTGSKWRRVGLNALLPILKSVDAHWVSLQYKDASKEIAEFKKEHPEIDLVQYHHGTLTMDYDDTVAMVSAMDHVIAMHTTIVHVAGGLGVPCWAFVPLFSQWRYGSDGEDYVWANSLRILRQTERGKWDDLFEKTAKELNALFPGISKTTGKTAQSGRVLRSKSGRVRRNSKHVSRSNGDRPPA